MININWKQNLFFVWLSQLLATAGFGLCMPFIPLFMREVLKVEESVRGIYVSAFAFAGLTSLCIATALWGMLADRFGRKLMLLRANFGAALLYPLLCFAPDIYTLIGIRFLCSFFSGTANPARTLLLATTPEEKHGYVLGVFSTATTSGHMIGYFCGGIIVELFGYKAAFLSCGALYIIGGLLVQFFVKDNFVRQETKVKKEKRKKLFSIRDLASPAVAGIMILFLLMGMSNRITQPFAAMLVEVVNGQKNAAFWTGTTSIIAASGGLLSGCLFGWISDKVAHLKLLLSALAITVFLSFILPFSGNIYILVTIRFLSAFAGGCIQPLLMMLLSSSTDPELKGTYLGWSGSIHQAGGLISAVLSGTIVWFCGVRGVYVAGAFLMFLMIPFILYMVKKYPAKAFCKNTES